jgi:hypothetical protein
MDLDKFEQELAKNLEPPDTDKDRGFHTGLQTGSFPSTGKPLAIASHTSPTSWMCTEQNWDVPGKVDPGPSSKVGLSYHLSEKEVSCKGYTASVELELAVYHQFSLKSMAIPHVSLLYNQLKTYHLALIPFNLGPTFRKRNNTYLPRCLHWLQGPVPV